MRGLSFSTLCLFSILAFAQDLASSKSLIEGAHELIISDETNFVIQEIDESILSRKYLACILDRYADHSTSLQLSYDDFSSIIDARVNVYNKDMEEIKSYKVKDFKDYSASGSNMASDSRMKYINIKESQYPYFIEVSYEKKFKGSMHYPKWIVQPGEKISVLSSKLNIESYLASPFRHLSNISAKDSIIRPSYYKMTWEVDSLRPFNFNSYSYEIEDYSPVVFVAPSQFQMNGITGDLSSWESFGNWIYHLNKDRNTLTEVEKSSIKQLVNPDDEKIDKVRKIYDFLQKNTRYVSIQLGIGGWQPFESGFVHTKKYGDCKALTFNTQSMLEVIGIDSYYTLIRAGKGQPKVKAEFPNAHFNHAILTVPLDQDTIYLECTSQVSPFGYLGTFTSDRNALLIKENSSRIIHTKSYSANENMQQTNVELSIDETGFGRCLVSRKYSGLEIENDDFRWAIDKPVKEKTEWFVDNHNWGNMNLNELSISTISGSVVPYGQMDVDFDLKNAASLMSKRMFFEPFKFTNIDGIKLPDMERDIPLEVRYPFTQTDTINVTFNEHFYPESTIKDAEIQTKYGRYSITVLKEKNSYAFVRHFELQKSIYHPDDYTEFRKFIESVQKSDRQKLVLINKT